jgi:RHH-type proline utilization regulon transcriptional repressor/proline dehydrogenase/delta 1-pyrroline-5-carboxylate dehydrogenase
MASMPAQRLSPPGPDEIQTLRECVRAATLRPEGPAVIELREALLGIEAPLRDARARAIAWVRAARSHARPGSLVESLLAQFSLDSTEGKALMSLAEALLRTPDALSADRLIAERLAGLRATGHGASLQVRLGLTLLRAAARLVPDVRTLLGEPATHRHPLAAPTRRIMRRAMRLMGHAFIVGESIDAALARGRRQPELTLCSFDMLGEGARTEADARRYFEAYRDAIEVLGRQRAGPVHARSGISIKLSALEPRYQLLQRPRVLAHLVPRAIELARCACRAGIPLTVDAEEADRLDLSLDVIEALARDAQTRQWEGLGLAVQAYGRRAPLVID